MNKPRHLAGATGQFKDMFRLRSHQVADRLLPCIGLGASCYLVSKGQIESL
ncbi:hypothetical protein D3C87_1344370 [compost metagenome]